MRAEGKGSLIATAASAMSRTILIAGAGIGGLTTALAVAAKGFHVVLHEKAAELE